MERAVLDDEFPVVVEVVVEMPGGLAVVGVVGYEGAIWFKYDVLNLAQNVFEPELAYKYYTAGLHSSTSRLDDISQVSRFMLGWNTLRSLNTLGLSMKLAELM